jgi:hypothetical protein
MKTEVAFDCPWCAGPMTAADAEGQLADSATCTTCAIVVEFAPDPAAAPVALAA